MLCRQLALGLLLVSSCRTQSDGGGVLDIDGEPERLQIVRANGNKGEIAIITCAKGYFDEAANAYKFSVPWEDFTQVPKNKLNDVYCTKEIGGGTHGDPNSGGGIPGKPGDFVAFDPLTCKKLEGVDLPNMARVRQTFAASVLKDSVDRCVIFSEPFERFLTKFPYLTKQIVDRKVRIYVAPSGDVKFDVDNRKLTVPYMIKGKEETVFSALIGLFDDGPIMKDTPVRFGSQQPLLWYVKSGEGDAESIKRECSALGPAWQLPTIDMVAGAAEELSTHWALLSEGVHNDGTIYVIPDGNNNCVSTISFTQPTHCIGDNRPIVCVRPH